MDAVKTIKKQTATRLLLSALFLFSGLSSANNFNYSNVEIGFMTNPSSLAVISSTEFTQHSHFIFSASSQFKGDWIGSLGAGFQAPLSAFSDIYGDAKIYSIKIPNSDKHDLGEVAYGINLGVRTWIYPKIEANLLVGQLAFDSDDTRSVVELGARFHSTDAISIGVTFLANGIYKGQYFMNVRFEL